jgi:tripeptide aminopeptidase
VRRASEAERGRLADLFADLCRIPSPSHHEAQVAERIEHELRGMGLEVERDAAGNLLASVGVERADRTILLCAHMDTVEVTGAIEPVLVDDGWENAHDAILGADNKAAVAVMLAAARRVSIEGAPVGVELLFTVEEEIGLMGAKAFDATRLRSAFGYTFDHATPIGEVIVASPTYFSLSAEFRGRAAHAGARPEDGRSAIVAAARAIAAMPHGRIDAQTTANLGSISGGGSSNNVVAERCTITAEARSLDPERIEQQLAAMIDAIHDGAAAAECDVDIETAKLFDGYRQRPSMPAIAAAEAALTACGYAPRRIETAVGTDSNALVTQGFPCVNLANGTERAHQPDERVAVAALDGMLDVALVLLEEAAAA